MDTMGRGSERLGGSCLCERSWKTQGPSSSSVLSRDWKKDQETECMCVYMYVQARVCVCGGGNGVSLLGVRAQKRPHHSWLIGRAVEHPLLSPSLFSAPKASSLKTKFMSGKEGTCLLLRSCLPFCIPTHASFRSCL